MTPEQFVMFMFGMYLANQYKLFDREQQITLINALYTVNVSDPKTTDKLLSDLLKR